MKKIFEAINSHTSESEIRYVGGCLRKILNNEKVDDIDLATNLNPVEVCNTLEINGIVLLDLGLTSITYKIDSSDSFLFDESKKDFFDSPQSDQKSRSP